MASNERLRRLIILTNFVLLFMIAYGGAKPTVPEQSGSNDETSTQIEEKGKSIDEISSQIEKSTNSMEDDIEKAGKGIDSPEAEKRIEIAGQSIDDLSDKMDQEIERQGSLTESATKSVETNEASASNADKHETLRANPRVNAFTSKAGEYEKQEKLRQKIEDLVGSEGDRVEKIGNEMARRDSIQRHKTRNNISKKSKKTEKNKLKISSRNKKRRTGKLKHSAKALKKNVVNKNATKRRVIIPVKRKKLEKMMLYYYVVKKMKDGELSAHNLESFFEKLNDFSGKDIVRQEKKKPALDLNNIIDMFGTKTKTDSNIEIDVSEPAKESKQPDLSSLMELIGKQLKPLKTRKTASEREESRPRTADIKSLVKSLMEGARVAQSSAASTSDTEDGEASASARGTEDGAVSPSARDTEDGPPSASARGTEDGVVSPSTRGTEDGAASASTRGTEDGAASTSARDTEDGAALASARDNEDSAASKSDSNTGDGAASADFEAQHQEKHESASSTKEDFTTRQVSKMLKSISDINATLLDHGENTKKHKPVEKSVKKCKEPNCAGREIISLLDKALKSVLEDKKADSRLEDKKADSRLEDKKADSRLEDKETDRRPNASTDKATHHASKSRAESRSKSDPYAGIGFTTDQEGNRNHNNNGRGDTESHSDVQATSRHIESHAVDVGGSSDRSLHGHHDDDDDEDDDDEDDDEDEHEGRHRYHYAPPMHQDVHHVHHHMYHPEERDHESYEHHGYHGNQLPVRAGHHFHEDGYSAPLNVDTAPMEIYPNRHLHDHLDVDSMLRGHPYAHHEHTPEVSLEGPISLAPVYGDMHGLLNGPGIHDQTDVHYEVEMHAHPNHGGGGDYHHHDDDDHHGDEDHRGEYDTHDDNHHADYDNHGDEFRHEENHEHGMNGDKKHIILFGNRKSHWKKLAKTNTHEPEDSKELKTKLKRSPNEEDDDDEDDDEVEKVPRNGYGVSRLSHLTEVVGSEMENSINNRIPDVEDVGRSIEESVQHGVNKVTDISNNDVEAPDYDIHGHMDPNIHREDLDNSDA